MRSTIKSQGPKPACVRWSQRGYYILQIHGPGIFQSHAVTVLVSRYNIYQRNPPRFHKARYIRKYMLWMYYSNVHKTTKANQISYSLPFASTLTPRPPRKVLLSQIWSSGPKGKKSPGVTTMLNNWSLYVWSFCLRSIEHFSIIGWSRRPVPRIYGVYMTFSRHALKQDTIFVTFLLH